MCKSEFCGIITIYVSLTCKIGGFENALENNPPDNYRILRNSLIRTAPHNSGAVLKESIKMSKENLNESAENTLRVSADVVAGIAATAAKEIDGVAAVSTKGRTLKHLIVADKRSENIKVRFNDGVLEISVGIIVKAGTKVKKCADSVQNKVKQDVQDMTGITVSKVNVYVEDVVFPDIA